MTLPAPEERNHGADEGEKLQDKDRSAASRQGDAERADVESSSTQQAVIRGKAVNDIEDEDLSLLDDLAEEFTRSVRRGEQPSVEEYLQRAPHLAIALRSLLETVTFLESTRRELETSEEHEDHQPLPESLGEYRLIRELGRGGMGIVCEAAKPSSKRRVAIKFLSRELRGQPMARKRFLREATLAMTVQHPNVVAIESVGEEDGIPYLVMELVEGPTLRDYLAVHHPLSIEQITAICEQMARGLDAAHQHGVVHRDIKPANALLCLRDAASPQVKITDFGLARAHEDVSLTRTGHVMGTPQNMSPEQVSGQPIDHRSDLFSLGTVFYELVGGQPAFAGDTIISVVRQIADGIPPSLHDIRSDLPGWLIELINCLLEKDPARRPPTAADVCQWILTQGDDRPLNTRQSAAMQKPSAASEGTEDRAARPRRSSKQSWALALSLGAILALAAFVIWSGMRETTGTSPPARDQVSALPSPSLPLPNDGTVSSGNFAIQFDGVSTAIRVPRLVRRDTSPVTLEAWVRTGLRSSAKIIALWGGPGRCQISVSPDNWFSNDESVADRFLDTPCVVTGEISPWTHLAYVADEDEGRLYLQGKLVAKGARPKPHRTSQFPNPPTWIGASPEPMVSKTKTQYHFLGLIDELRMSRGVRYTTDFEPATRWNPDEQTIALYHFDEQSGEVLRDSSGNGYDGQIVAAHWVKVGERK